MAWFWTDDLARALVDAGVAERSTVESWIERPIAISAAADADPLDVGRQALGLQSELRQDVA
jgi:hypothetical protein